MNFLTFRNFSKSGGGSIRILGILNAVAIQRKVKVATSPTEVPNLRHEVEQHYMGVTPPTNKRVFYLLLAILPTWALKYVYFSFFKDMLAFCETKNWQKSPILFFEYFDNAVGYFLKSTGVISQYYCDIHGIVPLENKPESHDSIPKRVLKHFKASTARWLDQKVFREAAGIIFPSPAIRMCLIKLYPFLKEVPYAIIEEACNELVFEQTIDPKIEERLRKLIDKKAQEKAIFFAGDFKPYSGVLDLIRATQMVIKKGFPVKLLMFGDGQLLDMAKSYVKNSQNLKESIYFPGRFNYAELRSHQAIADIIVCPDRESTYSNLLIHIKYYDALASGKVVINGSFDSMKQINPNQKLSLSFEPSKVEDLAATIIYALENLEDLREKYRGNRQICLHKLNYGATTKDFVEQFLPS